MKTIQINGAFGEGGGQILRTSLGLSLVTGVPIQIENIRANRRKPGLMRQHLTCVRAAKKIGCARVKGAEIGSCRLEFAPQTIQPGEFTFDVGTAGSSTLVFQTILPALLMAKEPSEVTFKGGTHNPMAPPLDFIAHSFTPLLQRMGAEIGTALHQRGFYPKGGGSFTATIIPGPLTPLHLGNEAAIDSVRAESVVVRLPRDIGAREIHRLGQRVDGATGEVIEDHVAYGPANILLLYAQGQEVTETFIAFGERGRSAEHVADAVAREFEKYCKIGAPVGEHLADQLLIPMALAGGGSFHAGPLSLHTTTNMEVIRKFLNVRFSHTERDNGSVELRVEKR